MLRYFHRPPELHHLRYIELFANFIIEQTLPRYAQAEGYECYETRIKGQLHHYVRRRDRDSIGCRMNTIYITAGEVGRAEEHTSDIQSLMRNSYACFVLKTKIITSLNVY